MMVREVGMILGMVNIQKMIINPDSFSRGIES
jgi:hypothetical protein